MPLLIKDIAGFFNVSERTIHNWIRLRRLPAHQVSHQYRFDPAELFQWAIMTGTQVSHDLLNEPNAESMPGIDECLHENHILHGIEGDSKEAVLRKALNQLPLPQDIDRLFLEEAILAGESLGSTGIGDGIAIPHARSPIILPLSKPMMVLCYLERPVDFKSIDGQPVTTLFLLICPTVPLHLRLLSYLGFILQSPVLKDALVSQATHKEIIKIINQIESIQTPFIKQRLN